MNIEPSLANDLVVAMSAAAGGSSITALTILYTVKRLVRKYGPPLVLKILCDNFPEWKTAVCEAAAEQCEACGRKSRPHDEAG